MLIKQILSSGRAVSMKPHGGLIEARPTINYLIIALATFLNALTSASMCFIV